jgi:hypothetical protein
MIARRSPSVAASAGTDTLLWSGVIVATAAALIVCVRVATQASVLDSSEGGWAYHYIRDIPSHTLTVVLIVTAAVGVGVRSLTAARNAREEWALLIAWIVVATGCQALLRSLAPFSAEQIFVSEIANSFYAVTQRFRADSVLEWFAELRGSWPLHAHSNMPGKLMLLYALELVSNDPSVLPWLLLTISNLGGLLLYLFVRDLFGDRRVALYAFVLYLFVPAKLFFFPLMNTVTPVVAFTCLLLLERWLRRASVAYAVAAGTWLYVLVFFEPIPLVIGALVALILARSLIRGDITMMTLLIQSGLVIAAFVGTLVLVWLFFDFNLVDALPRVAADAAAFNADQKRPYTFWLWRNLVEFSFGAGISQVALFWFAAAAGIRSHTGSFLKQPITLFSVALLGMLLALDVAGMNRGEVIRLWIFLACLFQVPAAYVCARLQSRLAFALVLILTIVPSALALGTIGFVIP